MPVGWPSPGLLDMLEARAAAVFGGDHFGVWALVQTEAEALIGDAGFKGPPDGSKTVEIGYGIAEDQRGQGYATEAARALTEWALNRPGVDAVIAHTDPGNIASTRTLQRVGFRVVGEEGGETVWRCGSFRP